ncbi:IKI3 family domain-containing protein [Ditylenchus destructor]|nr:IKI3 family domain-containing protein [Ditylenchus destructor]
MKNLRTYATFSYTTEKADLRDTRKFCVDVLNQQLFFALKSNIVVIDKNGNPTKEIEVCEVIEEYEREQLVSFDFLSDDLQLCMVLSSGTIAVCDENGKVESVACIPGPVKCGAWSPDLQLLILATDDMIYSVSRDFEIVSEEKLRPTEAGKDQLLTVGWGSRETQFQGSAGRKNREKVDINKVPTPVTDDDSRTREIMISWRADAQFFTVSSVDDIQFSDQGIIPCRQLRVWSRDLEFMSLCEFLAGEERQNLENLIATTRLLNGKRSVWFFERNGQYRGNFLLSGSKENEIVEVKSLAWNMDSTILAICLRKDNVDQVQLWTVSNFTWMEKLQYDLHSQLISAIWDTECPRKLHILTNNGQYYRMEIDSEYCCEQMMVVVADGDKLKFTDLSKAPIPPPMAHFEVLLNGDVPSAFAMSPNLDGVAVISSDCQTVTILNIDNRKCYQRKRFTLHCRNNPGEFCPIYNLQWKASNALTGVTKEANGHYNLIEIDLESEEMNVLYSSQHTILYQRFDSCASKYHLTGSKNGNTIHYILDIKNDDREAVKNVQEVLVANSESHKCKYVVGLNAMISLTNNHQLVVNNKILHQSVSSFSVEDGSLNGKSLDGFLLITTLDNFLHCISLNALQNWLTTNNLKEADNFFSAGRAIERGAQLVAHEQNGTRVWLQMPRGNLETINPRALLVHRLKQLLDELHFGQATREMRRHRINTNLIYDHNPKTFLSNVAKFVDEVDDVDQLNMFVGTLQEEDTTCTIFKSNYCEIKKQPDAETGTEKSGKINSICNALRHCILSVNSSERASQRTVRFYPVVLSCFVMEKPSRVADALSDMKLQLETANGQYETLLSQWLRHLGYLVDERTLYNQALKTYDLQIVLKVAESSDRDPREYLPVLNKLRKYSPPAYQRYKIDSLLEDYAGALTHLAELVINTKDEEKFEECIEHIKKYSLYSQALALFCRKFKYKEICELCADNAFNNKSSAEAAHLYIKSGNVEKALQCYASDLDYAEYIRLGTKFGNDDTLRSTLKKMIVQMESRNNFVGVAEVLSFLDRENNAKRILDCYCQALQWTKAIRTAEEYVQQNSGNQTLLEYVRTALENRVGVLNDQWTDWTDKLLKYSSRLEILRQTKYNQIHEWITQETDDFQDIGQSETLSEASTSVSNLSRLSKISTASSRKKKQIDRKKKQIKEGSHYEDAAILTALKDIYKQVDQQQDELHELLSALLVMDLIDLGRKVQRKIQTLLDLCSKELQPKIWTDFIEPKHLGGPLFEIYRGADGLIRPPTESLMPPRIQIADEMVPPTIRPMTGQWKLKIFDS